MSGFTRAEVCAVAIAETFRGDGEILVSPIGNLPQIGARLAKLTFAPDILLTDGVAYLVANVLPVGGAEGPPADSHSRGRPPIASVGPGLPQSDNQGHR